jgi:hypothetical protein
MPAPLAEAHFLTSHLTTRDALHPDRNPHVPVSS